MQRIHTLGEPETRVLLTFNILDLTSNGQTELNFNPLFMLSFPCLSLHVTAP